MYVYIWYIYIYIIYYIHAYICWISVREKSQLWQRLIVGTQPKSGKPTMNYTGTKVYHFWSVTNLWNKMKQTDTNSIRFTRFNPQSSDIRKVSQIFPLWCCYLYVCSKKQTTTMSTMLFSDCQLEEKKQENLSTFPNLVQPPHQPRLCIRHQQPCQFHADWRQGCARNQQQTDLNCGHGWTWGLHLLYWGFINLMGCKEGECDGM